MPKKLTPLRTSGRRMPIWFEGLPPRQPVPLTEDRDTDVAIIGAGLAGLCSAYSLIRAGKKVIVLDDGDIGSGESGRTTGHITFALDDRYYQLARMHGRDGARLAAQSHKSAIGWYEKVVRDEKIDCDFVRLDGYLVSSDDSKSGILEREFQTLHDIGMGEIELLPDGAAPFRRPAMRFPNQAQFHPLKFLYGLAQAIESWGGSIFTHEHVLELEGGAPVRLTTASGRTIRADQAIDATNATLGSTLNKRQSAYRTYVVALRLSGPRPPACLWWDVSDPYRYVRFHQDLLLVGGSDHRVGQGDVDFEGRFTSLQLWANRFYGSSSRIGAWSGQIMEPLDNLGFVGAGSEENVLLIGGPSGNGITNAAVGAMLLRDLVVGQYNEWQEVYDPSRVRVALVAATSERSRMVYRYDDWMRHGQSLEDMPFGSGVAIDRGGTQIAVHKDRSGNVSALSGQCLPGAVCFLSWNPCEETWDCQTHGSRFATTGEVLNGPALRPLRPVPVPLSRGRRMAAN